MKQLLILLFVLTNLYSKGQAKLEMSPIYMISPASANTPASTVTYSTQVSISVYVKNTGNAVFSGAIAISAKRDTTTGVFCDSISIATLLPLQPGDSLQGSLSFTPTPGANGFKVAGNGNTIVVWPFASGVNVGDSLRSIIWVNDVNGIKEIESGMFNLYPNPTINQIHIKPTKQSDYKKTVMYDAFAQKIKELDYSETIDVSELKAGSYWLIIYSDTSIYTIPFIKN